MEIAGKDIGELFSNWLNEKHNSKENIFSFRENALRYSEQYVTTFIPRNDHSVELFSGMNSSRSTVNIQDPNSFEMLNEMLSDRIAVIKGRLDK